MDVKRSISQRKCALCIPVQRWLANQAINQLFAFQDKTSARSARFSLTSNTVIFFFNSIFTEIFLQLYFHCQYCICIEVLCVSCKIEFFSPSRMCSSVYSSFQIARSSGLFGEYSFSQVTLEHLFIEVVKKSQLGEDEEDLI